MYPCVMYLGHVLNIASATTIRNAQSDSFKTNYKEHLSYVETEEANTNFCTFRLVCSLIIPYKSCPPLQTPSSL